MIVMDLLQCAKPLIFENEDEEFSYSLHGTIFLAKFKSRYFGITAQHCLRTRTRESVRLELEPTRRDFLPLRDVHVLDRPDDYDWNFSDLAFFEVEPNLVSSHDLQSSLFLDMDYFAKLDYRLSVTAKFALAGHPGEINWIDYERKVIHTQAYSASGHYMGQSTSKYCSLLKFDPISAIDDLDGLSGSPIFQFEQAPAGITYLFAGVLIRGSKSSGFGTFVDAPVVLRALELIVERSRLEQR